MFNRGGRRSTERDPSGAMRCEESATRPFFQKMKCLFGIHPAFPCYKSQRWIEVSEKRNKPPERFLHVQKFCGLCNAITHEGFFTTDQVFDGKEKKK